MASGRWHHSHCARFPRFGPINATCALPWFSLIFVPSWTTLGIAGGMTLALLYIEVYKKWTLKTVWRWMFLMIVGHRRNTTNVIHEWTRS